MLKGQIWSMDIIFAVVIFSFTMTVIALTWLHISNGLGLAYGGGQGLMYTQASAMADQIMSGGSPSDWYSLVNTTNAISWKGIAPGLAITSGQSSLSSLKLYALTSMANQNYSATKSLFGVGYDYYISISSPQGSGIANITIGRNPFQYNASTIFVQSRGAVMGGSPVMVKIMVWSNSTAVLG